MRKSSKRILFRASWRSPGGGAEILQGAKPVRLPGGDSLWSPSAGRRFCRVQSRYAYPAGAYFCMRKSRQNALGAVPQDPLTLKLRLDTNDAKASSVQRRRYALKVPAAHFMLGNCKPIAESHAAETVGKTSSYLPRRPLPRCGGGVGGAELSAASGGCSEAEHP